MVRVGMAEGRDIPLRVRRVAVGDVGGDYGMKVEMITVFLLMVLMIVLLLTSTFTFLNAKREIAKYNERAIESCYVLECNITFFGDLSCHTIYAGVAFNVSPSDFIELNTEAE